ncbi:MAG: NnrU family protein [Parvularculaceae bacterium]
MSTFVLGLIVFFASHSFTALFRGARQRLVDRVGVIGYRGLYSVFALAGLVLIIIGWRDADTTALYTPPVWMRQVVYVLMLVAIILLVAAYAPKGRIAAATKHPMLAGLKIWAFAHLLANGEIRSVLLFGAFLAFGILDRIAVKRRGAPVPAAGPWRNDAIAVIMGAAIYAAIAFYLHRYIAGVALI